MADILVDTSAMLRRVRYYIDEESQKSFSEADLLVSLNIGSLAVQMEIVALELGFYEKVADLNPSGTPPGTQSGVELYGLPSDFLKFKQVFRSDTGAILKPTTNTQRIIPRPNILLTTGPLRYYLQGNNVGFTPVPNGAIPIRMIYVYRIPTLVLGTDISELLPEWRDLACIRAAIDAKIKDEADTSTLEKLWSSQIRQVQSTTSRQIQEPKMVVKTDASW